MSEFWSRMLLPSDESPLSDRGCLRMILIGTPEEVMSTIRDLQARRFAEVRFWSPLLPIPESDQVLSIYTRRGVQASE